MRRGTHSAQPRLSASSSRRVMTAYAELAATTNFSFLRGASHPQEMVATAEALGLAAIGIADRNSFAGVVRAFGKQRNKRRQASRRHPARDQDGFETLAYPTDRAAYGRLCRLLTKGNLAANKGECLIGFEAVLAASEGQMLIALPPDEPDLNFTERLALLAQAPGCVYLAGVHRHHGDEPRRLGLLAELGESLGAPLVAVNDVLYHAPERRPLLDILTCIREKCTLAEAGFSLDGQCRASYQAARRRWRGCFRLRGGTRAEPGASREACSFSPGELKYEYPDEPMPPGKTAREHLADLPSKARKNATPRTNIPSASRRRSQGARRGTRPHRQARIRALLPHRP